MRTIMMSAMAAFFAAGACATAAKVTIEDRLQAIGLPAGQAGCMADQLEERLSSEDLQDLARYTVTLSRADSPGQAVDALLQIDNPRAVTAIGASGVSCIFAPRS